MKLRGIAGWVLLACIAVSVSAYGQAIPTAAVSEVMSAQSQSGPDGRSVSRLSALRAAADSSSGARHISALWALADALSDRGELHEAERVLREAAAAPETQADRRSTALRLAGVLTDLGDTDQASRELQSVGVGTTLGSAAERLRFEDVRGELAERTGDLALAEHSFDDEASEADKQVLLTTEIRARLNALRAHFDREEINGVEARLQGVDTLLERLPPSETRAVLELDAGNLYERAVREFLFPVALRARAYADLTRGQADARSVRTRAYAAGLLGEVYEDADRPRDALRLTEQAEFLAQSVDVQDQLYRWDWQAARLQQRLGESRAAEQSIDRALFALTQVRDDVLNSARQSFSGRIEPVYLEYADLHLREAAVLPDGSSAQQRILRNVRDQLESLKRTEVQNYFQNSCAANATGSTAIDIPGTAVIYPIVLPDRLAVLVESGGVLRQFTARVPQPELIQTVRRLRLALQQPTSGDRYRAPARQLYDWLLGNAIPWLRFQKVSTLIYVPGGALRTVPLAALYDGQEFVIAQFAVATTPAISLIRTLAVSPPKRVLLAGITQSVQGFPALPQVAQEIHTVDSMLPAQVLENTSFTLDAIGADLAKRQYSIAHLATHGEFLADYRSSFLLTYHDRLTLTDLQRVLSKRNSPLDLLVLSACDTAAGSDRAALGLAGVAVQSGAESALASLWSISDVATADLMRVFYQDWKSGRYSKAQSLREAQLALLHSQKYSHPSYWAPYLMIGDWR